MDYREREMLEAKRTVGRCGGELLSHHPGRECLEPEAEIGSDISDTGLAVAELVS